MKLPIIFIVVIVTIGFIISRTSLGDGGLITTFLVSFGLIVIIGFLAMLFAAKKINKREK
ncbi:hypothetical protein [Aliiglaciecola sp. LCG003]|uniref:hypothetical protein n=1 Tax=Aliiglaciecola sp. LCG003 TaxID=3053655 RepID=UPI002573976F|nr:hypothetical protein [Aliiglaciecola sp. LCG003]WJG09638.1 hypothetical protein QR722_00970 [Aliiglaciecola sp. LCG003]